MAPKLRRENFIAKHVSASILRSFKLAKKTFVFDGRSYIVDLLQQQPSGFEP